MVRDARGTAGRNAGRRPHARPSSIAAGRALVRLRDAGGSRRPALAFAGVGGHPARDRRAGDDGNGPLRVRVETHYGGGGGGGRVVVARSTPRPLRSSSREARRRSTGNELQFSLDGLPPGEPVTGAALRCSGIDEVTLPGFETLSVRSNRFEPDPDNNCTVGVARLSTGTIQGADGTPIPRLELSEIGPLGGGLVITTDHDHDGTVDRVPVVEIEFDAGPELRLPADSSLRVGGGSDVCGPGTGDRSAGQLLSASL